MLHIHSLEEEILILGKSENGEGTLLVSAAATSEDNGDGVQGTSGQPASSGYAPNARTHTIPRTRSTEDQYGL